MSKAIAFVGGTGTGKTTLIKNRLINAGSNALYIYDVNNEYKEFTGANDNAKLMSISEFTQQASELKNAVIVFEEATIFFRNRGLDEKMLDILVRKRHTNNLIFLVFHSLSAMPKYIFDLLNFVILFKTNDNLKRIDQKFQLDQLNEIFERVRTNKSPHYYEVFQTTGNIQHT